jgi:hypothetical protein
MMAFAGSAFGGRTAGRWCIGILGWENDGTRHERTQGKDKKYSFHVIGNDSAVKMPVSQFLQIYRGSTFHEPSHKQC